MTQSKFARRSVLAALTTVGALPVISSIPARSTGSANLSSMRIAARSPWLCNAVTATGDGTIFLGLPRFPGHMKTPSVARVSADGSAQPFPGGAWNEWRPGSDGRDAFVMVNAIHAFADGTIWVVDQGSIAGVLGPAAPKLVRLDPGTGSLLAVIRFDTTILPNGASMNDLRIHDGIIYVTDSGLGGIIVHDLAANRTLRRLSEHPLLRQDAAAQQKGSGGRVLADAQGKRPTVHSDMIELDADGAWLYWSTPTGPIRRVATALLTDESVPDSELAAAVQTVGPIPTIGGTAMDTLGNLYLSETESRRLSVLTPQGSIETLAEDDRLVSPDAIFIDHNRRLLVPAAQIERIAPHDHGVDGTEAPWLVLELSLPNILGTVALGNAVDGRGPSRGMGNIHGIDHVAMTVPDLESALLFLQQAFGASLLYRHIKKSDKPVTADEIGKVNALPQGARIVAACQVRMGNGANIELFEIEGLAARPPVELNDIGLVHFSVVVNDIHAAAKTFANAGGELLKGPNDLGMNETGKGNQTWFGRTPWGSWVELMTFRAPLQYENGAVQGRWLPERA